MSYKEGCVIVLFKEGVTENQAENLIKSLGLDLENKRSKWHRMVVVKVPVGEEVEWVAEFKNHSIVKIAELNIIHHLAKGESR